MSSTAQLVDRVLAAAHERLQQRCDRDKIIALLEDEHGAYDDLALRVLFSRHAEYETIRQQLMEKGAAPPIFLGPDNYGRCEWWLLLRRVSEQRTGEA